MAICPKCDRYFKKQVIVDGKVKKTPKRKFCFECSPWGQHNTRNLLNWTDNEELKVVEIVCQQCRRTYLYTRSHRKGSSKKTCNSCQTNFRRFKVKQKMLAYKGNNCCICNYNKSKSALCFHHIDDSKKTFNLSGSYCRSWAKIQAELDKCILVCANCHSEIHEGLINLQQYI